MPNIRFRVPMGIPFYPMQYISHMLILVSVVVSIFGFIFPDLIRYFGLHAISVMMETIPYIVTQGVLYQFLHGDILHILLNVYFLYQAWPEVESRMKRREFLLFFFWNTLFVAVSLWFLSSGLTIGISGFCMALLSYLYMDLQAIRHPMASQILIMLIINIALGLTGNISFIGHAAGAVFGILWWYRKKKW